MSTEVIRKIAMKAPDNQKVLGEILPRDFSFPMDHIFQVIRSTIGVQLLRKSRVSQGEVLHG